MSLESIEIIFGRQLRNLPLSLEKIGQSKIGGGKDGRV